MNNDWLTPSYPDVPGHRGVDTSIEAANAMAKSLGRLQRMVLRAISEAGAGGMTANELAAHIDIDRCAVQPRTSELRQMGKIRDSGQRRQNANGKRAIVWVAIA